MPPTKSISQELHAMTDKKKAAFLQRFFRTGKGEYAEGDLFMGITVPKIRALARAHLDTPLKEAARLLQSKWHEERLLALVLMVEQFKRADEKKKKAIFDEYLRHTARINNWDLVDLSAPTIVGGYLVGKKRAVLYRLVKSRQLWERRIAIVGTLTLIRLGEFEDTLKLSRQLLDDTHDLMHKAVGWMLREVGKKDAATLFAFLDEHAHQMPRTALRYSLERLPPKQKAFYMAAKERAQKAK